MNTAVTAKEMRENALALLERTVHTREWLLDSVDAVIDLTERAKALRATAANLDNLARELGDTAANWLLRSQKRTDSYFTAEPFSEQKANVSYGEFEDGGNRYRLTKGADKIVRERNASMDARFVASLPADWTKTQTKVVPDWKAARESDEFAERMAEFGLELKPSYTWTRKPITKQGETETGDWEAQ